VGVVHLVFNNDPFGDAVRDAARLRVLLGDVAVAATVQARRTA